MLGLKGARAGRVSAGSQDHIRDLGSTANMSDVHEVTNQFLDVNLHENQRSIKMTESILRSESEHHHVTIGATVPTGFEQTSADKVREKLRTLRKISKDKIGSLLILQ